MQKNIYLNQKPIISNHNSLPNNSFAPNKGFTLLELLIVIALAGVLSAIAVPIYQDYIARAQLVESVTIGGAYRAPIEDFINDTGNFPQGDAGLLAVFGELITDTEDKTKPDFSKLKTIEKIEFTRDETEANEGTMIFTLAADEDGTQGIKKDIRGKKVTFARKDSSWTCTTDAEKAVTPKGCDSATNEATTEN